MGNITNISATQINQDLLPHNISLLMPFNIYSPKGFIGRESELNELNNAKANGKTVFVLHGVGGVGKTHLALKFIEENEADYVAGIQVNMFGTSENPTSFQNAMLEVIRAFEPTILPDLSEKDINHLFVSLLNQHKTILFLDNAKNREQVEPLNHSNALVVVTSRTTFSMTGGYSLAVRQLSLMDARNLLYSIAGKNRNGEEVDNLAELAGYLPMSLLLLANILAGDITLKVNDLVEKFSNRKELLESTDPNRESLSVKASFDLTYDMLTEEMREYWRKLTVFPADFDLAAMQFIWEIEDSRTVFSELVKKHLLEYDKETKRSHLHVLARIYASEKLSDEERIQTEFRHCLYFGELLATLRGVTPENLAKFDIERTNIEEGYNWIKDKVEISRDFATLVLWYVSYANSILWFRLHFREYLNWQEIGLKASRIIGSKEHEAIILGSLGNAYRYLGNYQKAIEYHEQALATAKENNDQQSKGITLGNLGNTYSNIGEYQKAIEYHKKALEIAEEINDQQGKASRLGSLGFVYLNLREIEKAIEYYKQALAIFREIGDRQSEGNSLGNLGNAYLSLGQFEKAIDLYNYILTISREIGNQRGEGNSLSNLGNAYIFLGDYQQAIDYYVKALEIAIEIGDRLGEGNNLEELGNAYNFLGEYRKAIELYQEALAIAKQIGDRQSQSNLLGNLGITYKNLEEIEIAKKYYQEAIAILEAIKSPYANKFREDLAKLQDNS